MDYKVGSKGQIVIDHDIREALGIGPGWLAAQRLVGGHLEIRFFPPEHNRSLAGILANSIKRKVAPEDWHAAKEEAWAAAASEKEARLRRQYEADARKRKTKGAD